MTQVLVTGGAGFIGSHVVDALVAAGFEPRILDRRRSAYHRRDAVEAVVGDIRDRTAATRAMRGCDTVVHLAAAADVNEVAREPAEAESLNARGTLNLLEVARESGIRRFVYASTIWVYSDVDAESVDEDAPLRPPAHLYTATKLAGELYCRAYGQLYGLDCTILRFGIPYGPRARPAAVLPAFVDRALRGEPLTIAGSGEQSRRFVYVEDLAEGVVRALQDAPAHRTYNLVGDEDVSVRRIAETVRDLVGDVEVVHTEGRAGDFNGVEVSGRRAAEELGWRPRTSFGEGARRYVAWRTAEAAEHVARPARARLAHAVRSFGVAAVAVAAGALAAVLTRFDLITDPASLIGTMVMLGVPVVLVAEVDWARDRRRAALVVLSMLVGVMLTLVLVPRGGAMVRLAREHVTLLMLAAGAATSAIVARRRAART